MPRLSKIGAAALAAFGWTSGSAVSASYLVVAGGGGAGGGQAGPAGGGAGGLLTGTASLNPTQSYTVIVGAGGTGGGFNAIGASGSNSVFNTATSIGGGYGGCYNGSTALNGGAGGSGGGGGGVGTTNATGGAATSGQGFAGGNGFGNVTLSAGGGGGGAGEAGNTDGNGQGGDGLANSISGTSVTYAGGGGGVSDNPQQGYAGGDGGGGAGAVNGGTAGTANLGGGGGAGRNSPYGGNGGSGVVIISYVGAQQFSGGVVTSSGGNTIHTFTTSGTLGPVTPLSANYLVVAGGGSGGGGYFAGGGGAGGLLSGSSLTIDPYSTYLVTVGAGAAAVSGNSTNGLQGSNSAFSMVATAAVGGGYGAGYGASGVVGGVGGSGGGTAANALATVAAGTSGQGNAGGQSSNNGGGGGGGAGSVGGNAGASFGTGGTGSASSISGASITYAAGAAGGITGVGNGASGTANTGNGGAASSASGGTSGAGGSGVVIISYAGSTQLMAGGVVTIAGGNVIHTFNSSGYLTPLTLLTRSLRFRSSASAYLNRTPASAGNRKTWTWSSWVKRGTLSSAQVLLSSDVGTSNTTWLEFGFDAADTFTITAYATDSNTTSAVFRDPAAWYHVVVQFDSTQATAANRCRIYVNGTQQTLTGAGFTLNADYGINNNQIHGIGYRNWASGVGRYFDGYMAEINFIDGQALAPTAFGTVNSYGVWQPITYGGSYGTNGFRLPFTNNASTTTLGYDFSPQGNNWTTNNISVTAGSTYDSMTDVPTLTSATAANFATLNPLQLSASGSPVTSNGNLRLSSSASGYPQAGCTFGTAINGFKGYFEVTLTGGNDVQVGFNYASAAITNTDYTSTGCIYVNSSGNLYNNNSTVVQSSYITAPSTGGVIMIAFDFTGSNKNIWWGYNGTWGTRGGVGNPATGANPGITVTEMTSATTRLYLTTGGGASTPDYNFGQRPFAYTPPTGFVALNTFNL